LSPYAPKKPCAEPLCPALVPSGTRRCPQHMTEYHRRKNAARPAGLQSFYSSARWKALRAYKRRQDPLCELCKAQGRIKAAEQVDHIEPLVERPDLAMVLENLRSLCMSCHSRRTMTDQHRLRNR
jgi:5-methylcytosine-specific restriction enzyme A